MKIKQIKDKKYLKLEIYPYVLEYSYNLRSSSGSGAYYLDVGPSFVVTQPVDQVLLLS